MREIALRGSGGELQFNKLALLVVPALVLQLIATTQFDSDAIGLKRAFLLGSYALLIVGVLGLRGRVTRSLAVAGVLLNAAPIIANGGLMPTTQEAVQSATGERPELRSSPRFMKGIVLPRDEIRLYVLSDHIIVPGLTRNVFSPGDFVLALALVSFVARSVSTFSRGDRKRAPPSALLL